MKYKAMKRAEDRAMGNPEAARPWVSTWEARQKINRCWSRNSPDPEALKALSAKWTPISKVVVMDDVKR